MQRTIFSLAVSSIFLSVSCGQYQRCDRNRTLSAVGEYVYINHAAFRGSCRYKVYSPLNTFMTVACKLDSVCGEHTFETSRSGDVDMIDGVTHCGTNTLQTISSIGNEFVVALNTNDIKTANFSCKFTVVAPDNGNCDCGWNAAPRIVGGIPTAINEFAAHVAVVERATSDKFCGATIIQQKWAMSAAHCFVANNDPTLLDLLAGDHDASVEAFDTLFSQTYAVQRIIQHENYDQEKGLNDIALVEIVDYFRYNFGVGPACLPFRYVGLTLVNKNLTAVGWGTTSYGGPSSDIVLKADLTVINNHRCNVTLGESAEGPIDDTKLCTYGDKVRDTCGKDSGGGLYYYPNGRHFPIAIVNYGIFCASSYPSVNTRVTAYLPWIQSTVGGFFCRK